MLLADGVLVHPGRAGMRFLSAAEEGHGRVCGGWTLRVPDKSFLDAWRFGGLVPLLPSDQLTRFIDELRAQTGSF